MGLYLGRNPQPIKPLVRPWAKAVLARRANFRRAGRKKQPFKADPRLARPVSRDAGVDLEGGGPQHGLLRPSPAASPIAQERVGPGTPPAGFVLTTLALAGATLALTLVLGARGAPVAAEEHTQMLRVWGSFEVEMARVVAAGAQAAAVAGVAVAARRLSHSNLAGLLAAALVAADPGGLLLGSLGVPQSVAVAGMAWALAFAASPVPLLHWVAGLSLALATLALPIAALWILPLAVFLLLRGHIYAAPQHFGLGLAQIATFPVLALVLHLVLNGGDLGVLPACLALGPWEALSLRHLPSPGANLLLLPNPVVWMAGAGATAFLGLGGMGFALASFRIARAPGRLQVRLVSAFPPVLGRGVWLLILALLAPPVMWLPLFAIALAMGIRELGDDAPGFGLALALVLLAFVGLVLWRAWPAIAGDPDGLAAGLDLVPWAKAMPC